MFGHSLMRDMDEDPFFSAHRRHMEHMNNMFADPFGMMGGMSGRMPQQPQLQNGARQRDMDRRGQRQRSGQQVAVPGAAPFLGGDIFSHMNSMMSNMNQMMAGMHQNMSAPADPNSQFYSSSTVMSYSNDGSGRPKVYQATNSVKQAPGGVREVKKSVRDSEAGIEKMAVARHIGEKGHVITKQKNTRTGDLEENHDYIELDEDEAADFHQEFSARARGAGVSAAPRRGLPAPPAAPHHRGAVTATQPREHTADRGNMRRRDRRETRRH